MAKKLSSVLGIDIGSQKIKIAEIKSQGREAVITSLGMIDTPEGAVDHTGIFNPDAVGAALKAVISQSGATVGDAVVSIAGQASVLVRTLEVPRMNPAELKEHMQWEINRNIPFAESTVVSDFKQLADEDPNSPNMDVVMAIAPQSAIDTTIACVKKAGKKVNAIDVEPLGLARSLEQSYDDELRGQTVCVVDIGHKTTSINIYRDGKILMPRQVPIGGEMFTRGIADSLGVSMAEAETQKREHGRIPDAAISGAGGAAGFGVTESFQPYNPFADDTPPAASEPTTPPQAANPYDYSFAPPSYDDSPAPAPAAHDEPAPAPAPTPAPSAAPVPQEDPETTRLYNAFAGVLDEFTAEIRRSVDYFRSRGGDINRVLLCGGGSQLRGLPEFLTAALGLTCDTYDPTRRLNVVGRKLAPDFVNEHRQEFAVAVGNGLYIFFD